MIRRQRVQKVLDRLIRRWRTGDADELVDELGFVRVAERGGFHDHGELGVGSEGLVKRVEGFGGWVEGGLFCCCRVL